jgi:hypothetical protein
MYVRKAEVELSRISTTFLEASNSMQPNSVIKPRRGRRPGTVHNRLKCKNCRKDKQKVGLVRRDWCTCLASLQCQPGRLPFPQASCQRCEEKDLVCSELEKARPRAASSPRPDTQHTRTTDTATVRLLAPTKHGEVDPPLTNVLWNDCPKTKEPGLDLRAIQRM